MFFFKLAYNTKLNWLVVLLLPILGEILPFDKILYPGGKEIPTIGQLPPDSLHKASSFKPLLSHTRVVMHTPSSSFFLLKAKALNTVILFTDLHLKQKWNKNHNKTQNITLLKNYKPARKYSGSVYKLIAISVQNC